MPYPLATSFLIDKNTGNKINFLLDNIFFKSYLHFIHFVWLHVKKLVFLGKVNNLKDMQQKLTQADSKFLTVLYFELWVINYICEKDSLRILNTKVFWWRKLLIFLDIYIKVYGSLTPKYWKAVLRISARSADNWFYPNVNAGRISSQFHKGTSDLDLLIKGVCDSVQYIKRENVELIYKPLLLLFLCLYFCPSLQIFQRLQSRDLQLKRYGWWEYLNFCWGGLSTVA